MNTDDRGRGYWLACGVILLIAVVGAWTAGANRAFAETGPGALRSQTIQGEVRATQFILVDGQGRERAKIAMSSSGAGPELILMNDQSQTRAQFWSTAQGSGLILYDPSGDIRVGLTTYETSARLVLNDGNARPRLVLAAYADSSRVLIQDETGHAIWRAP